MSVLGAASARRPGSQALPSNRFAHNNDEEKAGPGCGQTSTPRAPDPGSAAALMRTTTPQLLLSGCDFVADGTVNNGIMGTHSQRNSSQAGGGTSGLKP
jgi:hypothetical protein